MTTIAPYKNRPPPETKPPETWQVGSLTYTTGGLAVLFCWLLWGDFAWGIRDRAVPPLMQLLFKKFGASDMVTALIFSSLPAALGMIIGPIVSYKSDRLRTPWGRRIPFLIVPVPFIVLSMIGLAFCPWLGEKLDHFLGPASPGRNWSVVIVMAAFWTLFEICCMTGNSLFGALVNDVVPQKIIGRFYGLFRTVGLIAGIIFYFNMQNNAESHFAWIFLGVGAFYGIGFTLMCLNVKEGEYPPTPEASTGRGIFFAVKTYFKDGLGNPFYLWFFGAGLFGTISPLPFNLYSLFYAKSIGVDMNIYFKCIALTYAISLCISYPLGCLADRFHPLRVGMASQALYAFIMMGAALLVRDPMTFAVALVAHGVASGCLWTAWASLGQRLLPREKFAEIGSVGGVLGALGTMLAAPVLGRFLDYAHHDYHSTFYISAELTLVSLAAYFVVHYKFVALGGPDYYVAPES